MLLFDKKNWINEEIVIDVTRPAVQCCMKMDNTTELWMTKYIIGEIFSSDRANLYKNLSDQAVNHFFPKNGEKKILVQLCAQ